MTWINVKDKWPEKKDFYLTLCWDRKKKEFYPDVFKFDGPVKGIFYWMKVPEYFHCVKE